MTRQTLALRDSVLVYQPGPATLQFLRTASGVVQTFEVDELAVRLIPLLDGSRTLAELERCLAGTPGYTPRHLREVLDVLATERLLRGPAPAAGDDLAPEELVRYDRQLRLFADLCSEQPLPGGASAAGLQRRLREAVVVVVGSGGIGAWLLASLAAAGCGRLRVVDFDVVEPSNLNRQVLLRAGDVGRRKVEVVAERLRALNPHVAVDPVDLRVGGEADLGPLLEGASVAVNCADQPSVGVTSGWVSRACLPRRLPHVVGGGYAYALGMLGMTVIPGRTPCWSCAAAQAAGLGEVAGTALRGPVGPGASIAMFTAVVANHLAWEVVRVVLGLPPLLAGRLGEIDFGRMDIRWRELALDPACPACGGLQDHALGGSR